MSLVSVALNAEIDSHVVFQAFAPDNLLGVETTAAIEAGYSSLPANSELSVEESAYSNAKAMDQLGWKPEHFWRAAEDEDVDGPSFI